MKVKQMPVVPNAFGHVRQNAVAYLALFVALGGTGAYAADTIRSVDVVDNEVYSADVRDDTLTGGGLGHQDLKASSVRSSEVLNDSLTNVDIKDFSLGNGDLLTGSVDTRAVTDNSLTGADIDESSLNLPPATTATFAIQNTQIRIGASNTLVMSKSLPAGSWVAIASAEVAGYDEEDTTTCELQGPGGIMGSTHSGDDNSGELFYRSVSLNGGAYLPSGGTISLYCRSTGQVYVRGQVLLMKVGGFS